MIINKINKLNQILNPQLTGGKEVDYFQRRSRGDYEYNTIQFISFAQMRFSELIYDTTVNGKLITNYM